MVLTIYYVKAKIEIILLHKDLLVIKASYSLIILSYMLICSNNIVVP